MAHLLLDEIIPRFSTPAVLLSNNGSEYKNTVLDHVCKELGIKHIFTSFYNAAANGKVEALHKVTANMLAKRVQTDPHSWDLHINQIQGAYRMSISETTKHSPFYMLYNRDPTMRIDLLLKPQRLYYGDQPHRITMQNLRTNFQTVRKNILKARRKANKVHDKNKYCKLVNFQINDPVFLKNHIPHSILDI